MEAKETNITETDTKNTEPFQIVMDSPKKVQTYWWGNVVADLC